MPQIIYPKLFQILEGRNTLVTPSANKINSASNPKTKNDKPTVDPNAANDPACQPISTTGSLIPVLSTIWRTILVTTGVNSVIIQVKPVKPTPA